LVGGSLDLWPIGIIIPGSLTVNFAINLYARVEARKIREKFLRLVSEDYGISYEYKKGKEIGKLPLIESICDHYGVSEGWEITVRSDFPTGSGLGGSSAISVALSGVLNEIKEQKENPQKTVSVLRDLEARNLKIPTGVQDFWPSILGGALAIHYRPGIDDVESLGQVFPFLKERIVVAYTGKSHFSAEMNFELYRNFLEGNKTVVKAMEAISKSSLEFYNAIKNGDFDAAGDAMLEEWHNRKKLSPKIATKKMEELEKCALKSGATGAKCCGAGGGGSMVFMVKLGMKRSVELALIEHGATVLNAEPVNSGVKVEVSK
ncbi:MAG: hypothetical protein N2445_08030, partial [Acidobacteria bacterium]|nr:hypothetical protein [Acidobacteriota bacterium]